MGCPKKLARQRLAALLSASFWLGCEPAPLSRTSEALPNVLVYVVDTLRADSLEPYGNPVVPTPSAARLAREGVLYERAYAHSSWTRPSIASLLTGEFPDVHGVETRDDKAPQSLRFAAEAMSEAGYRTGAIVTNPNVGSYFGFDQGYDDFIELFASSNTKIVQSGSPRARSDLVTARAIEWIDSAESPFFLFVLPSDPHSPYEPPAGFDRFYPGQDPRPKGRSYRALGGVERERAAYYGEVAFNDVSFGRLLDHLRTIGLYDDTLIVLSSDHGEEFGEHGHRWHGNSLFDEQIRVPLIIRRPGEPEPGRRVKTPVQLVDVHATLLAAAGLPRPDGAPGRVLPPEENAVARPIYARLELDGYSAEMLLTPPWKWIVAHAKPQNEKRELGGLFNLVRDPFEARDHRGDRPNLLADLRSMLGDRQSEAASRSEGFRADGHGESRGDLPPDVREALEVLGYLDSSEEPAENGGDQPDGGAAEAAP